MATFGRKLAGEPDTLLGYCQTKLEIKDPGVIAASGETYYLNAKFTGLESDFVVGTRFEVTNNELELADAYEDDARYKRVSVELKSGNTAWVYVSAGEP